MPSGNTFGFLNARESGILMHVTSLPEGHGIGDFGPAAFRFVDWMVQAGLKVWQVLPLVPPGKGFSPYSTWSSMAMNVLLVDLTELSNAGLLPIDFASDAPANGDRVDAKQAQVFKLAQLARAYAAFEAAPTHPLKSEFTAFKARHPWVAAAALYHVLGEHHGTGLGWPSWPVAEKKPTQAKLKELLKTHARAVDEQAFYQFLADMQWERLKSYAHRQGVRLVGDLPIYVDLDSVDVWLNQELFELSEDGQPLRLSGVPPDPFAPTGQLWGHPLYNWQQHAAQDYRWWQERLKRCLEQTEIVRIDHFRGFAAYWSVPAGSKNAVSGEWVKGPGVELFRSLEKGCGSPLAVIAEDLGFIDAAVRDLKTASNLPGMCVLEFGFGDGGNDGDAVHRPPNHPEYSVVYTGTHDNETAVQWRSNMSPADKRNLAQYFAHEHLSDRDFAWKFVELALASPARLAVVPLQDFAGLGAEARMNQPGIEDGNWVWRASQAQLSMELAAQIRERLSTAGRLTKQN
jgi:4-alpha-glucanotransferase